MKIEARVHGISSRLQTCVLCDGDCGHRLVMMNTIILFRKNNIDLQKIWRKKKLADRVDILGIIQYIHTCTFLMSMQFYRFLKKNTFVGLYFLQIQHPLQIPQRRRLSRRNKQQNNERWEREREIEIFPAIILINCTSINI